MPLGPGHILLVDDDESFLKFLTTLVRDEYGHRITTADSGEAAVRLFEEGKTYFDMMFLDYFMPGMTGVDLMRWMKSKKIATPVVILTGAGNEQVAVEAMKLGAYDYLRKEQIDIQHLETVIEATRERHLFRISKELDEERAKEIVRNNETTEELRRTINTITPSLNSALAGIAVELEINGKRALDGLPEGQEKESLGQVLKVVGEQVRVLESGISRLLRLYEVVYAHHAMAPEIKQMKEELEQRNDPSTP